ncbi:MAG: class I tRNA ligase family protein, partial [Gammaproteobacteria bacterium]
PPEQSLEWSDTAVEGAFRFLKRLWRLVAVHVALGSVGALDHERLDADQKALRRRVHETIGKVNDDVGRRYTFNTAIAAVMELCNHLGRFGDRSVQGRAIMQEALDAVVLLLAPIVPHIAESLWSGLGHAGLVAESAWPAVDPAALARSEIGIVVQVNGKRRANLSVPAGAGETEIKQWALRDDNVRRYTEGHGIRHVVVVPGRLINIVVD